MVKNSLSLIGLHLIFVIDTEDFRFLFLLITESVQHFLVERSLKNCRQNSNANEFKSPMTLTPSGASIRLAFFVSATLMENFNCENHLGGVNELERL